MGEGWGGVMPPRSARPDLWVNAEQPIDGLRRNELVKESLWLLVHSQIDIGDL